MLKLLFTPIQVGKMELKNRVVMPAMHYLASWEGMVLPHHVDYFAERAKGGAALIIIGGRAAGSEPVLSGVSVELSLCPAALAECALRAG